MKREEPRKHETETTTLLVKNMVCDRCIRVVREELEGIGLDVRSVHLGEVVIGSRPGKEMRDRIADVLENNGFELVENRRVRTIEQIKHAVIKLVRQDNQGSTSPRRISEFIEAEVGLAYHSLSILFSSVENITIEQYVILQKIERVKELLKYGELTLSEIAWQLGYSSVQHLSNQFRKVTGLTPSSFRQMVTNTRKSIDKISPRSSTR